MFLSAHYLCSKGPFRVQSHTRTPARCVPRPCPYDAVGPRVRSRLLVIRDGSYSQSSWCSGTPTCRPYAAASSRPTESPRRYRNTRSAKITILSSPTSMSAYQPPSTRRAAERRLGNFPGEVVGTGEVDECPHVRLSGDCAVLGPHGTVRASAGRHVVAADGGQLDACQLDLCSHPQALSDDSATHARQRRRACRSADRYGCSCAL